MKLTPHILDRFGPERSAGRRTMVPRPGASQVLIADDQASSRLGFRVALEAAGYGVTEAEDGEQALESLRDDPVDLALLDLRMPGPDGLEVLRRLQEEAIDVPVVVVTAYGDVPSAVRAIELGAVDFLAKPVEPTRLRETVLDVLVRRPQVGTESYRPATLSLGAMAHRFAETLAVARRTMKLGHFDLAEHLLQQALEIDPDSAAANTLWGDLHERLGEHHAAYQCYRRVLTQDRCYGPALDGMRRYCERFGLDPHNRAINPAE